MSNSIQIIDNFTLKISEKAKKLFPNLHKEVCEQDKGCTSSWYNLSDKAYQEALEYLKFEWEEKEMEGKTTYKNPVPHLGGKKWAIQIVFDYDDWIEKHEVKKSLEEWIKENGIPESCISNVTPIKEYK